MITGIPLLIILSLQYLNTPYVWGGQDFTKVDCSGLIVKVLREARIIDIHEDYTAQGLYDLFESHELTNPRSEINPGSLLFFGKNTMSITHVGICLCPSTNLMIHAGGGDRTTKTIEDAIKRDARVKISTIRRDLVASLTLDV